MLQRFALTCNPEIFLKALQSNAFKNISVLLKASIGCMTKTKPKRKLRQEAPQLSFGFYVLTYLAMAIQFTLLIYDSHYS